MVTKSIFSIIDHNLKVFSNIVTTRPIKMGRIPPPEAINRQQNQCHDSVGGSLKYWYKSNQVDHLVSNSAVWNDDTVDEAIDSCAFWVKDLPFVKSLSGHWKIFLADSPNTVPDKKF
ncbi:hypothetical protein Lal_00005041 [Lupinus albus]|nr:hypothetical protein Lal_00005041 [Lupinus albus]